MAFKPIFMAFNFPISWGVFKFLRLCSFLARFNSPRPILLIDTHRFQVVCCRSPESAVVVVVSSMIAGGSPAVAAGRRSPTMEQQEKCSPILFFTCTHTRGVHGGWTAAAEQPLGRSLRYNRLLPFVGTCCVAESVAATLKTITLAPAVSWPFIRSSARSLITHSP